MLIYRYPDGEEYEYPPEWKSDDYEIVGIGDEDPDPPTEATTDELLQRV